MLLLLLLLLLMLAGSLIPHLRTHPLWLDRRFGTQF
jgi:hypothetical protein